MLCIVVLFCANAGNWTEDFKNMVHVEFNRHTQKAIFSNHWFHKCNRHNRLHSYCNKSTSGEWISFQRLSLLFYQCSSNLTNSDVRWPEPMHHFILQCWQPISTFKLFDWEYQVKHKLNILVTAFRKSEGLLWDLFRIIWWLLCFSCRNFIPTKLGY